MDKAIADLAKAIKDAEELLVAGAAREELEKALKDITKRMQDMESQLANISSKPNPEVLDKANVALEAAKNLQKVMELWQAEPQKSPDNN